MPIYEYRCPEGHTFELFQRFADAPAEVCVECGAAPVTKVLYPAAVHFKGSGFYSTDYGRGARKKDGDEKKTSDDGAKKSDGRGEKPAKAEKTEKKAATAD